MFSLCTDNVARAVRLKFPPKKTTLVQTKPPHKSLRPSPATPMCDEFERKDEIRHRLRGILRLTSSKQKVRLLCGHVGLVKKGFHCRTREELQAVDEFLRKHFPQQMAAGSQIPAAAMEEKLAAIERTSGIGALFWWRCVERCRARQRWASLAARDTQGG